MRVKVILPRRVTVQLGRRAYHDESFGFRKPREFTLPDYSPAQLKNRVTNAPLLRYVDSVRTHGHRAARIDPLDLLQREEVAALDPARYGLTNPSQPYNVDGILWTQPVGSDIEEWWMLEDIIARLRSVYVGRIAYEYMHLHSKTERLWFAHMLEGPCEAARKKRAAPTWRARMHKLLVESETFDQFLQAKFPNLKRYGLEGGESMIPALDTLFDQAARAGVQHITLGMPHRGRLNLLTGLLEYSPAALFHKIRGGYEIPEELGAVGDVISHLVASPTLEYPGATAPVKVSLQPNPSHLEAVNPVAMGKTRAKQYSLLKTSPDDCRLGDRAMCVQLHGDASFTGQGVVMESLGLSNLPHFTSGGSVHIVVNIGYTTPASGARSSLYSSDIGKVINAPVLHVNGDYPEDVARAVETAFMYRHHFRKDVIVDLLVYRRWGHNELDEPAYTQPQMYSTIRSRKSVPTLYEQTLISDGVLTPESAAAVRAAYRAHLESELKASAAHVPAASMLAAQWAGMVWPASPAAIGDPPTGVARTVLEQVGRASVTVPPGFEVHPRLQRHVRARLQSVEKGAGLDWATAEAMAFGSLMLEGYDIRISGQDVGRGTFSQRHAMFVDQKTEAVDVPLNTALAAQGKLELANSSLSEMAVLGFEVGMSWETPRLLPIWEAQFGDFFNGAQVIIDTFVSSAETKWLKQSGLMMLLPHGLDGAGPEHSSARIERMLQLTNDRHTPDGAPARNVNMHVVYPTTAAQYFHLLRRQLARNYRKPLVVAGPKGLLRLPAAASTLAEVETGTAFAPVLDDAVGNHATAEHVLLVSGKLYYELEAERRARGLDGVVALVRIEELAPFPFAGLAEVLGRYGARRSVRWVQEEPRNQGAWGFVGGRIRRVLGGGEEEVGFWGRSAEAVPAPGVGKRYRAEQARVVKGAFEFAG
ncbi:dehydrogenase E1 and transketolase domain-containing protein 1 [Vararia minispora EC-137]|uniref:Dehydrogenase E1 and transketolase domain-containing protein 1 n=1 Tax=Vararia minispora EC-137 TaxID=1314806 RepID=A0ACB8QB29_9AGAM|nr:dehydrogenase E1 and transketolase domain-containing protein 1 [Vararia minispora EC-137]